MPAFLPPRAALGAGQQSGCFSSLCLLAFVQCLDSTFLPVNSAAWLPGRATHYKGHEEHSGSALDDQVREGTSWC